MAAVLAINIKEVIVVACVTFGACSAMIVFMLRKPVPNHSGSRLILSLLSGVLWTCLATVLVQAFNDPDATDAILMVRASSFFFFGGGSPVRSQFLCDPSMRLDPCAGRCGKCCLFLLVTLLINVMVG